MSSYPERRLSQLSLLLLFVCVSLLNSPATSAQDEVTSSISEPHDSVARIWNEALLDAIRLDTARPTVHARNLFHLSAAMWDAWAAYQPRAKQVFHQQTVRSDNTQRDQAIAISFAAYTLLNKRFKQSANYPRISVYFDNALRNVKDSLTLNSEPSSATALGVAVAQTVLQLGEADHSNEANDYRSEHYQPLNQPLDPHLSGNPNLTNPDRWQALHLAGFVGQSGIRSEGYPAFIGPEWGKVTPFALQPNDRVSKFRDSIEYWLYLDAGPPPRLLGTAAERNAYIQGFQQVIEYSSALGANDNTMIDISPAKRGNVPLGSTQGKGHQQNPVTEQQYALAPVRAADYYRVLAEFWADGPNSETPPGHWFVIFNQVSDHPAIQARHRAPSQAQAQLRWDLQGYLALGGAVHDAAIAAWSHKGWYDYIRPISAIRGMCDKGQSSDRNLPRYNKLGVALQADLVELVTEQTATPGGKHHHLAKADGSHLNQIALNTWRGPQFVHNRRLDVAEVGWIPCGDWWPYQRPNFVTPPFAAYVSGHSTFSRAAAEVLSQLTGSDYFPGGLGVFNIKQNQFLVFEQGPSRDIQLQWATYQDAADDCSLSRIYGGIHPPQDDLPGRLIGYTVGRKAFAKAQGYFPN